jgi:ADP-heptose:LPS heptosyltransferase
MAMTFKNILLINFGGIGDEILFLPTIATLKKEFPNAEITLCLEPRSKSIKDLTPLIDNLIFADIKACGFKKYLEILKMLFSVWGRGFDLVVSSGKSPQVAILEFLCGIKTRIGYKSKTSHLLTHAVELNENQYAANMYHDLTSPISNLKCEAISIEPKAELPEELIGQDFIVVHPGVSKMSIQKNMLKCPKSDFWIELISGILAKGKRIVLLGGPDDKEIIDEIMSKTPENPRLINFFGKTKNIAQMAKIIQASNALICVDSAPMHIGVGVGTKVLAIFGPTNEEKLIPKRENCIVAKTQTPCRPCLWDKRQTTCETLECLNIKPEAVLEHIN